MTSLESLDFVDVLSHDEFRDIVQRYKPHRLVPLREALIAKSNDIQDQRLTPRSLKTNRDGTPMDEADYEDWSAKARTAQNCTDRQIQIVTETMRQPHNWGNGTLCEAIAVVMEIADCAPLSYSSGFSEEESACMSIVRHYLDSVNPQRSVSCTS